MCYVFSWISNCIFLSHALLFLFFCVLCAVSMFHCFLFFFVFVVFHAHLAFTNSLPGNLDVFFFFSLFQCKSIFPISLQSKLQLTIFRARPRPQRKTRARTSFRLWLSLQIGCGALFADSPHPTPCRETPLGKCFFFLNWQQLLSRLEIIIADNLWCVIFIYWLHLNTVLIFHWLLKQKKAIFELWMTRLR